ncbi:MAG TPA: hypothetical protein PKE63_11150 [Lacibacter sp.]|nr:hypothetical protein [Lacibacter sp.]HMO88691.1 hypothetical protein [Lacibacter sp.]HMP87827.1 hypothetical protein [Lacibacter sp.]
MTGNRIGASPLVEIPVDRLPNPLYFYSMFSFRHITVCSLLLLYAMVYTPVAELFKLPVLLAHYQEHKTENETISLLQFLRLHYFTAHERATDVDKHMQLPFKAGECTVVSLAVPALPAAERTLPDVPVHQTASLYPKYTTPVFHSAYAACIWQPPRA